MALESQRISTPASYILAVVIGVAAALLRWPLTGIFGNEGLYLTVFPAVMLCGIFMGIGPGILSAIAGVVCIELAFADPSVTWPALILRSLLVIISAGTVAYLGSAIAARRPSTGYLSIPSVQPPKRVVATAAEADVALREAITLADAAKRAKERFLSQVSHKLRSPLTQAQSLASQLEQNEALSSDSRETLGNLRQHLDRETRLIDDLLDMTRVASGRLEIYRRPLMLHEVVKNEVRTCADALKRQGTKLVLRLEAQESMVSGDPARLGQVIASLLSNAVRCGAEGGAITITTANSGKRIQVVIENDGPAITPAVLAQIFDVFEQGDTSGGLGLGLAICKGLVVLHGGSIKAKNRNDGQGARFEFDLPLLLAVPQDPGLFPATEI